ncbi:hypothetical protein [Actinokineospora xionganensis]|uniref:Uncharacterized protein n=1 Tax=Actinokineospora xionganensis TaxID=2684470 RepID=A0ABR7LFW3_9PSEU|nr:hypothetical protein [Actinokineospora xionganensis]MBC6451590.1 hypothetical protein [Actinokineospora xionganensis]
MVPKFSDIRTLKPHGLPALRTTVAPALTKALRSLLGVASALLTFGDGVPPATTLAAGWLGHGVWACTTTARTWSCPGAYAHWCAAVDVRGGAAILALS